MDQPCAAIRNWRWRSPRSGRARRDIIKPFRRLFIAGSLFRPQPARLGANRVGFEQIECSVSLLQPRFNLAGLLEYPHEERCTPGKAFRFNANAQGLPYSLLSVQQARLRLSAGGKSGGQKAKIHRNTRPNFFCDRVRLFQSHFNAKAAHNFRSTL